MQGPNTRMTADTTGGGTGVLEEKGSGTLVRIVGKLPINDTFRLRASLGKNYMTGSFSQSGPGIAASSDTMKFRPTVVGIGGEMNLDRRSALRLELTRNSKTTSSSAGGATVSTYDTGVAVGITVRF